MCLAMRWWVPGALSLAVGGCAGAAPSYFDHYERARLFCAGVPEDASPLDELGVAAVRPIAGFEGRPRVMRTRGVRLFVRGRTGWTASRLEQWTKCRIERMALLLPEERAGHDPLAVEGVRAEVRAAEGGFELLLTSERGAGSELDRRARALVATD